jgi:hypothetical protein
MTTTEKIEDLIGKECVYTAAKNMIPCRIKKVFVQRELKWPYESDILLEIEPLHRSKVNEVDLEEMQQGVNIHDLLSIEWE